MLEKGWVTNDFPPPPFLSPSLSPPQSLDVGRQSQRPNLVPKNRALVRLKFSLLLGTSRATPERLGRNILWQFER